MTILSVFLTGSACAEIDVNPEKNKETIEINTMRLIAAKLSLNYEKTLR